MKLSQKLVKNTTIHFCGQLANLGLNLVILVWLARYLGESRFGMFSFALVFVGFFAVLPDFGMKPIIVREIARDRTRSPVVLGNSFFIKLAFSSVAIVGAIVTAVSLGYDSELVAIVGILSLNILVSAKLYTLRVVFESIYEADLRMEYPVLFRIVDGITLTSLIALVIHMNGSLRQVAIFYTIGSLPGIIVTIFISMRYFRPEFTFQWDTIRWLLAESFPLAIFAAIAMLCNNLDVFLLKMLAGNAAVGYYSAAFRLVYPLDFIPAAIVTSLFPLMSKYYLDSKDNLVRSFHFGMKTLLLIGVGFGLGATFLRDRLIRLLYTDTYSVSAVPFMILMWAGFLGFLNFFMLNYNISVNQQRRNMLVVTIMLLVSAASNLLLIPRWGVIGASLAKFITALAGLSILSLFIHQRLRLSLLPTVSKIIPIGILFALWLFFVSASNLIFVFFTSPLIFILFILLFKIYSDTERKVLKEIFVRIKS